MHPIKSRKDLPHLLNELSLIGECAEVGILKGKFSKHILKNSNMSRLYCIDPWIKLDAKRYKDINNVPQWWQNYRYIFTILNLIQFKDRCVCIRMKSDDAVNLFKKESLDFIYIDSNHDYESCKKDLNLWWPKLKKGGIFSGHDYVNGEFRKYGIITHIEVKKAVDEFINIKKRKLFVTKEAWPTWYLKK